MMMAVALVARKDHGHVKAGKDASKAGDVGTVVAVAGEKCDQGPTCLLHYMCYCFVLLIRSDGRKFRHLLVVLYSTVHHSVSMGTMYRGGKTVKSLWSHTSCDACVDLYYFLSGHGASYIRGSHEIRKRLGMGKSELGSKLLAVIHIVSVRFTWVVGI